MKLCFFLLNSLNIKSIFIDNKEVNVDSNGKFNFICDVFQGQSGESESSRLKLPLLGKISIDSELSKSCDKGIPFVKEHEGSIVQKEFEKISKKIIQA